MAEGRGPWQESHRAWERLAGWWRSRASQPPEPLDEGEQALNALADIGLVRRMLDQTEFEAVRDGRRHGKSWAEIAIRLGVTRQSAWERWRDVDEPEGPQPPEREPQRDIRSTVEEAASETVRRARGETRRRSTVTVPNVIGMSWEDARKALHERGLVGIGPDPDGPPLAALTWPDGVVTDQSPESGAKVPPGSAVTLWTDRGGGSGVREPRRPKPDPKTGRKMRDEMTDEAVG
jgi:hypothetical protein